MAVVTGLRAFRDVHRATADQGATTGACAEFC